MKELLERFLEKNCKKQIKQSLVSVKQLIKKKGDKLYVKWEGYNSSFNNFIDKEDSIT